MKPEKLIWLGLLMLTLHASAQVSADSDWQEGEVPAPPSFSPERLISIEMPKHLSVRLGIDPKTFAVTSDGIVRYVMVVTNAGGSISAMYEGIRCASGEVKTYAQHTSSGQWTPVANPTWRRLNDNLPSNHARALARQGVCDGRTPAGRSAADIVNALKYPKPDR